MRRDQKLYVASFCGLGLTVVSGMALSQVPEEALAVDSVNKSVPASVTVGTACTMGGKETDVYTKTVQPGTYTAGIGSTTLTVACNDPGGFDVYAVGFSGDTWGNTDMIYSGGDDDYNIATGTATSGNTSNWAMMLTAVDGDYKPTIMSEAPNNYTIYHAVPRDATKVASFFPATSATNDSKITTTYAVNVSSAQAAGTYEGKVKYSLVHPVGAPAP